LEIVPKCATLSGNAPGIDESVAEKQIGERHAAWCKRLPDEAESLWTFIHELSDAERLELLAHCVSLTVNAVRVRGTVEVVQSPRRIEKSLEKSATTPCGIR